QNYIFLFFLKKNQYIQELGLLSRYSQVTQETNIYRDILKPVFLELLTGSPDPLEMTDIIRYEEPEFDGGVIPNEIFEEIFKTFEMFEWALKEKNTSDEAIQPDILGYIYERDQKMSPNSRKKEARKRKETGSFFTDPEIAEIICKETLYPHLLSQIREKTGQRYQTLDEFFVKADKRKIVQFYFCILSNLRILDPAVGSGVFLLAIVKELLDIFIKTFQHIENLDNKEVFNLKKELIKIENTKEYYFLTKIVLINIFAVDIQELAIETTKRRLWLLIASHSNKPAPFPNLDYNLRVGNSLIGLMDENTLDGLSLDITQIIEGAKKIIPPEVLLPLKNSHLISIFF
ncbi:MAG: DNA methyltransferase, partial [Candidatus Hodarchaeota archaeon]